MAGVVEEDASYYADAAFPSVLPHGSPLTEYARCHIVIR